MEELEFVQNFHFNSQPHEEADSHDTERGKTECISTHSLTKRLTIYHDTYSHNLTYFNSQPHEEADVKDTCILLQISISTHSLTKRLTLCGAWFKCFNEYFNSQPHEEADDITQRMLCMS